MMWRLKFFLDFEKEEKWLEEMAWKGYQLKSDTFGYRFKIAEPEDTKIKIDHRVFNRRSDFINYCTLFEGNCLAYLKRQDKEKKCLLYIS
uniref:DUF2812 domain-containing protein n=1 Tax=Bacillus mycoides TaxID=1405 RepID=UPI001F232C00